MKNLKFIILVLFLFAQGAVYAVDLDFGLEFGLSNSLFKIKDDESAIDNDLGYGIGSIANIEFGKKVGLGAELWYTRNTMTLDKSYYGEMAKIKSNSLDLPLFVSYRVLKPLSFIAGPSFSLFSTAKADVGSKTHDIGRIKPTVGYIIGAKLVILKVLVVGARFNGGFEREDVSFNGSSDKIGTCSYTISVGAKF